jgi:hypothetical protein
VNLTDGTRISGFVTAEENRPPRECGHCVWYKSDLCHNPLVMIDDEVEGKHGEPKKVGERDCCNGFQSSGKRTASAHDVEQLINTVAAFGDEDY